MEMAVGDKQDWGAESTETYVEWPAKCMRAIAMLIHYAEIA